MNKCHSLDHHCVHQCRCCVHHHHHLVVEPGLLPCRPHYRGPTLIPEHRLDFGSDDVAMMEVHCKLVSWWMRQRTSSPGYIFESLSSPGRVSVPKQLDNILEEFGIIE